MVGPPKFLFFKDISKLSIWYLVKYNRKSRRTAPGWDGVLGPQLGTDAWGKDRRKDLKQCVPNFCENNPFHSVCRETAPFHCLANFDNPEHWVIFSITTWKTDPFLQKLYFSYPKRPKRWQRCALPSSEKVPFLIVLFCSTSVPSFWWSVSFWHQNIYIIIESWQV